MQQVPVSVSQWDALRGESWAARNDLNPSPSSLARAQPLVGDEQSQADSSLFTTGEGRGGACAPRGRA